MKVIEHIEKAQNPLFSFEIIPPKRSTSVQEITEIVKDLTGAQNALSTNSNGAGIVALLTIYRHYFGRTNVLIQSNTMYGV